MLIAFYAAGEVSRAEALITRALKTYSDVDLTATSEKSRAPDRGEQY